MDSIPVRDSSGNLFADLGIENPDEHLAKVKLSLIIERLIQEASLSPSEAARVMGVTQSDVSEILRGVLDPYSLDCLLQCARALGQDVKITLSPAAGDRPALEVAYV